MEIARLGRLSGQPVMKILLAVVMLGTASVAHSAPLTVRAGESWIFKVRDGQPTDAHKVNPAVKPAKGQVMVTVRSLFGTVLITTNNSGTPYSYNAELYPSTNLTAVRACALPSGGKPSLEQWEQKAQAVRISNFRAAGNENRC
jgi:hypothetical protein